MSWLSVIATIVAMALLNRLRGGGWWAIHLPGHPRWYVIPAVTILAIVTTQDPVAGGLFGAAYGIWTLLPWGHLYSFGRWTPPRPVSGLERSLLRIAKGRYWVALLILHGIGVVFLAPLVWWNWPGPELSATILMPFLIVAAYEVGWIHDESRAISRAELIVGSVWGLYLVLMRL